MYPDDEMLREKKKQLDMIRASFSLCKRTPNWLLFLFHYTSLPTLFNMLETDTLWASATRFSNDSMEEQVIPAQGYISKTGIRMDNFQFCLSQNGDCLSQWRGYCPDGGAAIELDLCALRTYSVLHKDYEINQNYEAVRNAPFRVIYVPKSDQGMGNSILEELQEIEKNSAYGLKAYSLIPYFKHDAFEEEAEWRILFENTSNEFSKCVRFRTLRNGAKVPYLVVKCGDIGKYHSHCIFDESLYDTDNKLAEFRKKHNDIIIPPGNDQEEVYYRMKGRINSYLQRTGTKQRDFLHLVCEGHLPVKRIILAPTYNRDRLMEEVRRFCSSIYWLQDVEVVCSKIPYIPPSE